MGGSVWLILFRREQGWEVAARLSVDWDRGVLGRVNALSLEAQGGGQNEQRHTDTKELELKEGLLPSTSRRQKELWTQNGWFCEQRFVRDSLECRKRVVQGSAGERKPRPAHNLP